MNALRLEGRGHSACGPSFETRRRRSSQDEVCLFATLS